MGPFSSTPNRRTHDVQLTESSADGKFREPLTNQKRGIGVARISSDQSEASI